METTGRLDWQQLEEMQRMHFPESSTLDFKRELFDLKNKESISKFVGYVVGFANLNGGRLLYGVEEDRTDDVRTIADLPGIGDPRNLDDLKCRLQGILDGHTDPKISGIEIYEVLNPDDGRIVLVVQIPRSWTKPHMVKSGDWRRAIIRASTTNRTMDWTEIRSLFRTSETLVDSIGKLCQAHVERVFSGNSPMGSASNGPWILLGIVPMSFTDPRARISVGAMEKCWSKELTPIASAANYDYRINSHGLRTFSMKYRSGQVLQYTQIHRTGVIEAVTTHWFDAERSIVFREYEKHVCEAVRRYVSWLLNRDIFPPFYVYMAMVGVRGFKMYASSIELDDLDLLETDRSIEGDCVIPEPVVVENTKFSPEMLLRPIFDTFWNASGLPFSLNYDQHGDFRPFQSV